MTQATPLTEEIVNPLERYLERFDSDFMKNHEYVSQTETKSEFNEEGEDDEVPSL